MGMTRVNLPHGGHLFITPGVIVEYAYRLPSGRPVKGSVPVEQLERFVKLRPHCSEWAFQAVGGQIRRMK